ncbi:DUF2256 and DUF3253 domain-containing protein [Cryobacterium sp. TMT1-21]|uniref:DUF2256 and DUF3253 domain-containing protein n=1 Tax=Cryobacterium shii TaxID=1259235 RepID=A0AAQ2C593_9MICO|nr:MULTISPECIES: DUF2256 and DUF3253 domain-containing protein [Cryobacterium]TFC44710.1 DUF2256 and DUF3253 domain-containing protein [Cryobacterium shii]TFC85111.1 DUF2256 and DUF3253 domain-containing protein [Cryobacterium sp. TmT2-59]TFD10224.1 DUF2256 and DUF3253 domain-containing protein [Cryobacterium sp. TMT1-21]TFD11740.1 DUF2256 and DUF3253 domain-containing protein [Cryobacterium sp. TMT4-10]TFD26125.1 DUF2256 and DUF3253 domain-containing protein [Cryobacterium sp. TMT2-23]
MAHRQRKPADPDAAGGRADKTCASCGRRIEWRAKWADNWDSVKYCSAACRGRGVSATDLRLEESIATLLGARAQDATICPSEAAKVVGGEGWCDLMEPARRAARRLVARGELQITQGGTVVDPSTAKGPIRLRRVR